MKHKPALIPQDVEILFKKKQLGVETPENLLQTVKFNIMRHFKKQGQGNMREVMAENIQFHKLSCGLEYYCITLVEMAMKIHLGDLNSSEN